MTKTIPSPTQDFLSWICRAAAVADMGYLDLLSEDYEWSAAYARGMTPAQAVEDYQREPQ